MSTGKDLAMEREGRRDGGGGTLVGSGNGNSWGSGAAVRTLSSSEAEGLHVQDSAG